VLTEKLRGGVRLAAVCPRAHALGLIPGLTLADARARLPALRVVPHAPVADRALLDWLATACARYTPTVAAVPPQALVLDITGCEHPYHGEAGLVADLAQRLKRSGLTVALACADTPDAAVARATFGSPTIADLPVDALRVAAETHAALRRAGLRTVGALAGRPRGPLAARFGKALTDSLDRLTGAVDAHIVAHRATPAVAVEARFAEPVALTTHVMATLDLLLGEAAVVLAARGAGGRRFEAALFRSDGHVAALGVETGTPTRDPRLVARLFAERIDGLADPLDPGFGYDLIRILVPVCEPLHAGQLQLDGGVVGDAEFDALLDRLATRLGRGRIRRLRLADSHIPEQAAFELPHGEAAPAVPWEAPAAGEPPLRPLHLFASPLRIEVMAEVPDGPPRWFKWQQQRHDVARAEGPERIAAEWWKRRSGRGATRDYYRVEDARGQRFWLFRHGLYGTEKAAPEWYLHGLFA